MPQSSTPALQKSPLDPSAGSVPVPAGEGTSGSHEQPSIGHDVNSAHVKKDGEDNVSSTDLPGLGTSSDAKDDGAPNWQNQDDILDAAAHGDSIGGQETEADVAQLKKDQHPDNKDATEFGPSGLSEGKRNMEEEGTSEHDKLQQDLMRGKPSRDGEGSAGLPFDAGN